jgi:hypothetical protein
MKPELDYDTWDERTRELALTLCRAPHFDPYAVMPERERLREWQAGMDVERTAQHWVLSYYNDLAEHMVNAGDGEDSTPKWRAQGRALLCEALHTTDAELSAKVSAVWYSKITPMAPYWWLGELINLTVE